MINPRDEHTAEMLISLVVMLFVSFLCLITLWMKGIHVL
jgi:hypothetical protein